MIICAESGESFWKASQRVMQMANAENKPFNLRHNNIEIRIYPGSHEYDIEDKYQLARRLAFAIGEALS